MDKDRLNIEELLEKYVRINNCMMEGIDTLPSEEYNLLELERDIVAQIIVEDILLPERGYVEDNETQKFIKVSIKHNGK